MQREIERNLVRSLEGLAEMRRARSKYRLIAAGRRPPYSLCSHGDAPVLPGARRLRVPIPAWTGTAGGINFDPTICKSGRQL